MPGEVLACRPESGCAGERVCRASGLGYDPCMCREASIGSGGAAGSGGGESGANEGGAAGEPVSVAGAGGEADGGQAGADPGDAGVDAGCQGLMAGCACVDRRCGPGLGCAADDSCIDMPTPVAHWPLDDDADEVSTNDFNGLGQNGVTFDGTAAHFDGLDSFIDVSACAPKFKEISTLMSVYVRVRAADWQSDPLLFGLGDVGEDADANGFWFVTTAGGLAAIDSETGAGVDSVTALSTLLPTDSWLDLTFVIDQDVVQYFQNAQLTTTTQFTRPDTNATHMQIGGWITPENVLRGEIDDVQLFDVKLTQAQVEALPSTR